MNTPYLPASSLNSINSWNNTYLESLKQLQQIAQKADIQVKGLVQAIERLQSQKLTLVVVGEFKKGKSTFINALLGESVLPADILPTTATINRVVFGSTQTVTIHYKNQETHQISIDRLEEYVTKLTVDSANHSSNINEVVLHYPLPLCKHGFEIIDTPGLNDDDEMSAVTLGALDRTQVAILVTSVIAPFAESESLLLETLLNQGIRHLIFVVNGIDEFKQKGDIDRLLENITQRIQNSLDGWLEENYSVGSEAYNECHRQISQPSIYGISAQQALLAKQTHDDNLLAQSRFLDFENALSTLLIEKRHMILQQISAGTIIASCEQILSALTVRLQSLDNDNKHFVQEETEKILTYITELRSEIRAKVETILEDLRHLNIEVEAATIALPGQLIKKAEEVLNGLLKQPIKLSENEPLPSISRQICNALMLLSAKVESEITTQVRARIQLQIQRILAAADFFNQRTLEIEQSYCNIEAVQATQIWERQKYNASLDLDIKPLYDLVNLDSEMISEPSADAQSEFGLYAAAGAAFGSLLMPGIGTAVGGSIAAGYERNRRLQALKNYKSQVLERLCTQLDTDQIRHKVSEYVTAETREVRHHAQQFRLSAETTLSKAEQQVSIIRGAYEAKESIDKKQLDELQKEIFMIQQRITQ